MRLWRGFAIGLALWCGHLIVVACGGNPAGPPLPTPTPVVSATPSPISRIFPSRLVHADGGTRWEPPIYGGAVCCDDAATPGDEGLDRGWELIDRPTAEEYARHGINAAVLRTGPYPNHDYSVLRPTVDMLWSLGMHGDVSLLDGWTVRHRLSAWPNEGCEIFRSAPKAHHRAHVRRVVQETLAPHIYYTIGNEVSLCGAEEAWYRGIYDEAKAAGAQIVGGDADHDFLDFQEIHGWRLPIPLDKPMHLSESNNEFHAPQDWLTLFRNAEKVGGTVYYWPGPASNADRAETLRLLKEWLDGGKSLVGVFEAPDDCPTLTKWGTTVHHCETGRSCVEDSTPKYGPNMRPCNEEKNATCSSTGQNEAPISAAWRRCEDARGPEWFGHTNVLANPFQARVAWGQFGTACPRPDARDYYGKPLNVGSNPCTSTQAIE